MRKVLQFFKATIAGGFFVVLPVVLAWMVVTETIDLLVGISTPFTEFLLGKGYDRVADPTLVAIVVLILVCLVTGLAMRTRLGLAVGRFFERTILEAIPGYTVLRTFVRTIGGIDTSVAFTPAVLEGAAGEQVPVLAVEEHANGSVTVLIPLSPTPTVGSVQVVQGDRVRLLEVPLGEFMECYLHMGSGVEKMLNG